MLERPILLRPASSQPRFAKALAALLVGCALLTALPAQAQRAFATRYSNTAVTGDIVLVGNMNLHCPSPPSAACTTARGGGAGINNSFAMAVVDIDGDPSTTNSSSTTLALPAGSTVLWAGLYWAGGSASAARTTVSLRTPASAVYQTINATTLDAIGNTYQGFRDVTALVQAGGNGTYFVGNIAVTTGGGNFAGWQLVVAYSNAAEPTRNLNVFDGWALANNINTPIDLSISGFITPATGPVSSRLGLVVYDGDLGNLDVTAGQAALLFGPTIATLSPVFNGANPISDVYNSTISDLGTSASGGNPNYRNTLGVDVDRFTPNTPLPNSATSAVVRVRGQGSDVNYPGVVTLATQVFVPNLQSALVKSVVDVNGGLAVPGDVLEYTVESTNSGNDNSILNVLRDVIPANTTYEPGTLVVVSGANSGAKTDAAGDDQAEFDAGNNRVVFRLGTGANATTGGGILPTESFRVTFRVRVNAAVPGGTVISNQAVLDFRGQTLNQPITANSDSDGLAPGQQPALTPIATAAVLTVTKTNNQTEYVPGATATYVITISNAGPAPGNGSVVRDVPDARLTLNGLSCSAATGGAVCPSGASFTVANLTNGTGIVLPTLPVGGSVTLSVTGVVN